MEKGSANTCDIGEQLPVYRCGNGEIPVTDKSKLDEAVIGQLISYGERSHYFAQAETEAILIGLRELRAMRSAETSRELVRLRGIVGDIHEATGEDRNSDDDSLADRVRRLLADLRREVKP